MSSHTSRPTADVDPTFKDLIALPGTLARRITGAHLVWALLVAATLPWRRGIYYEGGADAVVLAKAGLSLLALLIAIHIANGAHRILGVPASPLLIIAGYLTVTVIGGFAHGTLIPAAVVAIRMAIVTVTVVFLFTRYSPMEITRSLVHVLGLALAAGTLTGLPSIAQGRLAGAMPPLHPNVVGFFAAVCFLWVFRRMLQAHESTMDIVFALVSIGIVVLSGSRASLAALVVATVAMTLRASRLNRRTIVLVSLSVPVLTYVVVGTDLLSSVFLRGGERGVATLSNRTVAWDAALNSDHDPWETWFGAGLAQKKIEVPGQWWQTQLLDSSWVSALVQGGLIGIALVLALTVATVWRALISPPSMGALWFGLVVFVSGRAILESGLFDSSITFMVFLVTALGCRLKPLEIERLEIPSDADAYPAEPTATRSIAATTSS